MAKVKADIADKTDEAPKSALRETVSTVLWALAIAFVMRTFLFQPFHIPSGSMLPGLMKGDYIITSKYSVGYGPFAATPLPFLAKKDRVMKRGPARGDVIVFRPKGITKNYIKRVIGLPGDQIQMQSGLLMINGTPAKIDGQGTEEFFIRQRAVTGERQQETLPSGETHIIYNSQDNNPLDNTAVYTVPAGYYFMMGDNRDHSLDSRVPVMQNGAGYIPSSNIMGKAEIVLLSVTDEFELFKPWTWGNMRGDRFFKGID